jgi:hypothetical protein
MHGTVARFHRAVGIGTSKSVSFEKKNSVKFEIFLKKVLEIKKISPGVPFLLCGRERETGCRDGPQALLEPMSQRPAPCMP